MQKETEGSLSSPRACSFEVTADTHATSSARSASSSTASDVDDDDDDDDDDGDDADDAAADDDDDDDDAEVGVLFDCKRSASVRARTVLVCYTLPEAGDDTRFG